MLFGNSVGRIPGVFPAWADSTAVVTKMAQMSGITRLVGVHGEFMITRSWGGFAVQ
jgi:hypothetical protein